MKGLLLNTNIQKCLIPALLAAVLGFMGCVKDPVDKVTPGGSADGITLNPSVPGMKSATRGVASETEISELDVIVFDSSDKFVEYIPARIIATELGGGNVTQAYVPMKSSPVNFSMVVVANARSFVEQRVRSVNTTTSKSDFLALFEFFQGLGDVLWNSGSSYDQLIPMCGDTGVVSGVPSESSYIPVQMVRSLARIDFYMKDQDSDFEEIRFMNYLDQGSISTAPSNVIVVGSFSYTYKQSTPFTSVTSDCYVYEQAKVDETYLEDYENSPHIIVKAKFEGNYYYYRINFTYDGSVPGTTRGEYMPVLRNHRYNVVIGRVTSRGYDTVGEASSSAGETNNLDYDIHVVDDGASGSVVYDGSYYLTVDKEDLTISVNANQSEELTIYTNYNHIAGSGGWTAVAESDTDWLRFEGGVTTAEADFNVRKTVKVYSNTANNSATHSPTGTITVTAGKMKQVITVTQSASVMAGLNVVTNPAGGELVFRSWRGELIEPEKGQILVEWVSGDGTVSAVSTPYSQPSSPHTFVPFKYSSSAGYDDLASNVVHTYTNGSQKLLNITPEPLSTEFYEYPSWSSIVFVARGANSGGGETFTVPVKHKNIFASIKDPKFMYVASSKVIQPMDLVYNTDFLFEITSDPDDVLRLAPSTFTFSGTMGTDGNGLDLYRNPFEHSVIKDHHMDLPFHDFTESTLGKTFTTLTARLTSTPDPNYPDPSSPMHCVDEFEIIVVPVADAESNCYVVYPGQYAPAIPISWANKSTQLGPNWVDMTKDFTARVEWSDVPGVVENLNIAQSTGNSTAYLVVKAGVEGNAVVSVQQDGVTRWTWHIWVSSERHLILAGTGKDNKWMDRNLGAKVGYTAVNDSYAVPTHNVSSHVNDLNLVVLPESLGLYYQWGRKDPFPCENYYYDGNGTLREFTESANMSKVHLTMEQSLQNPLLMDSSDEWDGTGGVDSWTYTGKTIFDPCPAGWRMPKAQKAPSPYVPPTDPGSLENPDNETPPMIGSLDYSNGYLSLPDYGAFTPTGDRRSTSISIQSRGKIGSYWYTSISQAGNITTFDVSMNPGQIAYFYSPHNSGVYSVRCVRE